MAVDPQTLMASSPLLGDQGAIAVAAALAVVGGALGTAWSQSSIGSAAMGAVSEKPEIAGNVLLWIAIPETIVILGFLVAFFLIGKLTGGGGTH